MDLLMDILKERPTTSVIFNILKNDDLYGLRIPETET